MLTPGPVARRTSTTCTFMGMTEISPRCSTSSRRSRLAPWLSRTTGASSSATSRVTTRRLLTDDNLPACHPVVHLTSRSCCPSGGALKRPNRALSLVHSTSSIATPEQQEKCAFCNCLKQHASQLTAAFKCEAAAVCCRSCDPLPLLDSRSMHLKIQTRGPASSLNPVSHAQTAAFLLLLMVN